MIAQAYNQQKTTPKFNYEVVFIPEKSAPKRIVWNGSFNNPNEPCFALFCK